MQAMTEEIMQLSGLLPFKQSHPTIFSLLPVSLSSERQNNALDLRE
jgi:hypothetical protein